MPFAELALVLLCSPPDSLAELRAALAEAPEAGARADAAGAVADLAADGSYAAEELADALALGLEDPDYEVRAAVGRALARIEPAAALPKLIEGAELLFRDYEQQVERLRDVLRASEDREEEDDDLMTRIRKKNVSLREQKAVLEVIQSMRVAEDGFIEALGTVADDRAVDCLIRFLEHRGIGRSADPVVESLLALGSRDAVGALVDRFGVLEDQMKEWAAERRKIAGERPGRTPDGWTDDSWERQAESTKTVLMRRHDDRVQPVEEWGRAFGDRPRSRARVHGYTSRLPTGGNGSRQWKSWWRKHRSSLPESLGQVRVDRGAGRDG